MGGQKKKLPSNCKTVRISKILLFKMEWKEDSVQENVEIH